MNKRMVVHRGELADRAPVGDVPQEIELKADPVGSGAFGEVFRVQTVDGSSPSEDFAVKILTVQAPQLLQHARDTTYGMVRLAATLNDEADASSLFDLPGLAAYPQLVFETDWSGKRVPAYLTRGLFHQDIVSLQDIAEPQNPKARSARAWYKTLSPDDRLHLAYQFAQALQVLTEGAAKGQPHFIHADLNPPNILIDTSRLKLTLIDYDGGCVVFDPNANPTTWGKMDDWMPPEVQEQLKISANQGCVDVTTFTDLWGLGLGVFQLLFTVDPFAMLQSFARRVLEKYQQYGRWPHVEPSCPVVKRQTAPFFEQRVGRTLAQSAYSGLRSAFDVTFNEGVFKAERRTTAGQWEMRLRRWSVRASGSRTMRTATTASPSRPGRVDTPHPSSGATVTAIPELSWKPSANAASYSVYLGAHPQQLTLIRKGLQQTRLSAQELQNGMQGGAPSSGRTHYWRIDAENSTGVTQGPIWEFNMKAPPPHSGSGGQRRHPWAKVMAVGTLVFLGVLVLFSPAVDLSRLVESAGQMMPGAQEGQDHELAEISSRLQRAMDEAAPVLPEAESMLYSVDQADAGAEREEVAGLLVQAVHQDVSRGLRGLDDASTALLVFDRFDEFSAANAGRRKVLQTVLEWAETAAPDTKRQMEKLDLAQEYATDDYNQAIEALRAEIE